MPRPRSKKSIDPDFEEPNESVSSSTGRRRSRVPKRYMDDSPAKPAKSTPAPRKKGRPRNPKNPTKKPWHGDEPAEVFTAPDFQSASESSSEDDDDDFKSLHDDLSDEEDLDLGDFRPDESMAALSCPWVEFDQEKIQRLVLPESSQDIPISMNLLFDVVEIYEILRTYNRTLHLKPFTFEDFCSAMLSSENSCILAEVHISLLKMCLRNDDDEQIQYSVVDTNISFNAVVQCLEAMTYGEVLRQYICAWSGSSKDVIAAISTENYPYVDIEKRLVVLIFLCYRFLNSHEYKRIATNLGKLPTEDACRACGKSSAPLLACTMCECAQHAVCQTKEIPETGFVCENCTENEVHGVSDARPIGEDPTRESLRMTPIGRDRHGRLYFFVARRIFIQTEDESELRYYSTAPQFYELVRVMDPEYFERDICAFFSENLNDIFEQMSHTLELTVEVRENIISEISRRGPGAPLTPESIREVHPVYLHEDDKRRMAPILRRLASQPVVKKADGEESTLIETIEEMMGFFEGRLLNNFWAGNIQEADLLNYGIPDAPPPINMDSIFRYGDPKCENNYQKYVNHYATSEIGDSAANKKKIADRKKYLCNKLYFHEDKDYMFKWVGPTGRSIYGSERLHIKMLEVTISSMSEKIPIALMHRLWPTYVKKFNQQLHTARNYKQLAELLGVFEARIRRPVFLNHWWAALGHLKLSRTNTEEREQQSKLAAKKKKDESDLFSKDVDDSVTKVNYRKPGLLNFGIARFKGESFRVGGRNGQMGGWMWVSSARKVSDGSTPLPFPFSPAPSTMTPEAASEIIEEKKRRLDRIVIELRTKNEMKALQEEIKTENGENENGVEEEVNPAKTKVRGEDEPWPLLTPETFRNRSGKKSIFHLPKDTLKHLARTGGMSATYLPGFSNNAKQNLSVWNYPSSRPCMDLCWKYLMTEVNSLHAVALQLRLLWSSIRWMDMEPPDDDVDRRVVISLPEQDERREIIAHKEYPPYGYYERYHLRVEVFAIDDLEDDDQEHDAWSKAKEREPIRKERKRNAKMKKESTVRRLKGQRKEWIDGVELKLFEIQDYWEKANPLIVKELTPSNRRPPYISTSRPNQHINMRFPTSRSIAEDRKRRAVSRTADPDYVYENDDQYDQDPMTAPPAKRQMTTPQVQYTTDSLRFSNQLVQPTPARNYTQAVVSAHYNTNRRFPNGYYSQTSRFVDGQINMRNNPGPSRFVQNPVGDGSSTIYMAYEEGSNGHGSGVQSDQDDGPPQIPKYENVGHPVNSSRTVQPHRQFVYTSGQNAQTGARQNPVFLIKRGNSNGKLVRVPAGAEPRVRQLNPGSILVHPNNSQRIIVRNNDQNSVMRTTSGHTVRLAGQPVARPGGQTVRRVIVARQPGEEPRPTYVVAQPPRTTYIAQQQPGGPTLAQMQVSNDDDYDCE